MGERTGVGSAAHCILPVLTTKEDSRIGKHVQEEVKRINRALQSVIVYDIGTEYF
jgi:hypothetical protein